MIRTVLLASTLTMAAGPAAARTESTIDFAALLEPRLQAVMDAYQIPGVSVGIVHRGAVAYARGFGVASVETSEPVTEHSLFHMASNT